MNKQDSYEELLELEKKRKKRTESFRKFLSIEANADNETINKIFSDLLKKREILPLEKMTDPSIDSDKYNSLDIYISARLNKVSPDKNSSMGDREELYVLDTQIISLYGEMILAEKLEVLDVLDRMMELCMDTRKKEITRLETEAEFNEKLIASAGRYAKFLSIYQGMEKEAALSYVFHLMEVEKSVQDFRTANDNIPPKDDYPYPPTKGKTARPAVKKERNDGDDILHLCELSSAVNIERKNRDRQREERKNKPFKMEDLKNLEENINRQINSLFCKILSAKTSHEIDVLNGIIDTIFNKKSDAINALSMMSEVMKGDKA